jgi:hypothetical protein
VAIQGGACRRSQSSCGHVPPQPTAALDCRVGLRPPRNDAPKDARRVAPSPSSRGRRPWRSRAALAVGHSRLAGTSRPSPPPHWIAASAFGLLAMTRQKMRAASPHHRHREAAGRGDPVGACRRSPSSCGRAPRPSPPPHWIAASAFGLLAMTRQKMRAASPHHRHREAAGRGDPGRRLPSVTVVLQARAAPQPTAALDCRVGLRPPRNDVPKDARRATPSPSSRGRRPWRSSAAHRAPLRRLRAQPPDALRPPSFPPASPPRAETRARCWSPGSGPRCARGRRCAGH